MNLLNYKHSVSFPQKVLFLLVILLSATSFAQKNEKEGVLKFKFICDHSQTTIIADQSIMVYVMSLDEELLVKEMTYCSKKELSIPQGTYSIVIESSKYCTHVIENYLVTDEEQKIELNLLKESDPDCKNEKNFEPHPTRFN